MHRKRQYLYAFGVMCIALTASCKTVPVQSCWGEVTHRVNGDRLSCVSYQAKRDREIRPTDDLCMRWDLYPGTYLFSVRAIDCEGLTSDWHEPVEFEVKGE